MVFPRDLLTALKNLFLKFESFLAPFIKSFANDAGKALLGLAVTAIAKAAADPTLVSNADKRNAALKELEAEALAAGIKAGETALLNALQAAYSNINPEKAAVSFTTTPTDNEPEAQ